MRPNFDGATASSHPFPHASVPAILPSGSASAALAWLKDDAPWTIRTESFYEQYEFSLLRLGPPPHLAELVGPEFIDALRKFLSSSIGAPQQLDVVDISAHKLVSNQTIKLHNDFIGAEETHRVLIQLNEGWNIENGGLLMLFGSDRSEDVTSAFLPVCGSGFAFEISPQSYHAVSTIKAGERFTIVYTFRTT